MGMGLSIAQSIVEVHGGTISARNAAQGAIVEFMLPLAGSPELV
jgi:signal transduction histidine kinase